MHWLQIWQPEAGVSMNDFRTFGNGNGSAHSQTLGTGMKNCIPNFWEREWIFHSQFLQSVTGMEIIDHGVGPLALLVPKLALNCPIGIISIVLSWHLHQPESHQSNLHNLLELLRDTRTNSSDTWVRWECKLQDHQNLKEYISGMWKSFFWQDILTFADAEGKLKADDY